MGNSLIANHRRCPHRLKVGATVVPVDTRIFLPFRYGATLTHKWKANGEWWGQVAGVVFPLWKVRKYRDTPPAGRAK